LDTLIIISQNNNYNKRGKRRTSGSRFVDDALDLEASDATGVFGGLALMVVKVGWYGDDSARHSIAQVILSHLDNNKKRDKYGKFKNSSTKMLTFLSLMRISAAIC